MQASENMIVWHQKKSKALECPLCESRDSKELVLTVKNHFPDPEYLDLYKCKSCEALFFHPLNLHMYNTEPDKASRNALKFYIESAAGIESMVSPLLNARNNQIESFLDVGCGFGFTVDFASKILGWNSIGVEPSFFAESGAKLLDAPLYSDYLQNVEELKGKKFNLVYSSEVIEHTDKPLDFVRLLNEYVNDDGILALTTPNAECVQQKTGQTRLLAVLSPGYHLILFSEKTLKNLLDKLGFKNIVVDKGVHSITVYASKAKMSIKSSGKSNSDFYIKYLKDSFDRHEVKDPLSDGFGIRLFKEYINYGEYEKANALLPKIKESIEAQYDNSVIVPAEAQAIAEKITTFDQFGETFPYNICVFYFYNAFLNLVYLNNYSYAAELFRSGFELTKKALSVGISYFVEEADLLWQFQLYKGEANMREAIDSFLSVSEGQSLPKDDFINIEPTIFIRFQAEMKLKLLTSLSTKPRLRDSFFPKGSIRRKLAKSVVRKLSKTN